MFALVLVGIRVVVFVCLVGFSSLLGLPREAPSPIPTAWETPNQT